MKPGLVVTAMVLLAVACASPGGIFPARRDPARITQEEIVASLADDAYDAVAKLRGNFLASRGMTGFRTNESTRPAVFVDGLAYGPISTLRLIPASNVAEIRLYQSWEATTIFGTGYMAGVIAVTTRR